MHLDQNVSLKSLNTFGIEVSAKYFVEAKTHSEVLTLLNYRHMIHMPILFLGSGSNVLFTKDFGGIVIRINSKGIVICDQDEHQVQVTAEAGENWDDFVRYCVEQGWAGPENLSLIPGTVGAAPIQNIGAYGVEAGELIESVTVAEISSGKQRRYSREECRFGYRDSIFKQELKGKVIILDVTFRLNKIGDDHGDKVTGLQGDRVPQSSLLRLDYGDIRAELQKMEVTGPTIRDVREAVCNIRRRKLPDPAVTGNAGSFFKNPVISTEKIESLRQRHPEIPYYPEWSAGSAMASNQDAATGRVKVPAAWLIDRCGWKGFREGDAGVHPNQPLVLVNYGTATGQQIVSLAGKIKASVLAEFGISLDTEVNIV